METAIITTDELGQLVRLPPAFRIDASEVYVKHKGRSVQLIPQDANPWEQFSASLENVTEDFMQDRDQPT